MTQQNAALVEESAAAAESLKDQAARLAQAVSAFKLGSGKAAGRIEPHAVASTTASSAASSVIAKAKAQSTSTPAKAPAEAVKPAAAKAPLVQPAPATVTASASKAAPPSDNDWETF